MYGGHYWLATKYDNNYLWRINNSGGASTYGDSIAYGIRVVVTLKAEVCATANPGNTTHTTKATAWNLSM